jgi:TP901 family phage tail tape measure protein
MLHVLTGTAMATVDTQKALGELASVGVKDMAALETAAVRFSNQWAGTAKSEFIAAAYDIKSGISSLTDAGVADFTRLAALTGKATKSSTAEMTSLFATGYGIYKDMYGDLSDLGFGEVFSAGIAGSVKSFKTTGSGMAQAISSLGSAATVAKRPMEEQLAVLGMLQATMSGSEAGTAYKAVIRDIGQAGKKLGMNFYDANNNLKSLPEILTTLQGKFGDLTGVEGDVLKNAFADESYKTIAQLYSKVGDLTGNIQSLGAAMRNGTAVTEQMAAAMNQDIGAGLGLFGQQWHNLVEVIGKQMIPVLAPLFSGIGRVIMAVAEFAERHDTLTRVAVVGSAVLATLAFTLGGLAMALGVVGLMTPAVSAGLGNMVKAAAFLKTGLVTVIPAVWGFTAALLANPITWIVLGVVALIAALVWLYKRFEGVRNVVKIVLYVLGYFLGAVVRVGKGIWLALQPVLSKLAPLFRGLVQPALLAGKVIKWVFLNLTPVGWLIQAFGKAEGYLAGLDWRQAGAKIVDTLKWGFFNLTPVGWLIRAFTTARDFLSGINLYESGAKILGTLVEGIKSRTMEVVDSVTGVFSKVRNLLPFSDAKEGPLSSLTLSGARIMETLGAGVQTAAPGLHATLKNALAGAALATTLAVSPVAAGETPVPAQTTAGRSAVGEAGRDGKSITIQNLTVQLPGVVDAESFVRQLQALVGGYDA